MDSHMVIAVNEQDEVVGLLPKMEAHLQGVLHRAISVFIFNNNGDWLLQRRAQGKYHSEMLWSNTACTHPLMGEPNIVAAQRRLEQEMGLIAPLQEVFQFIYKVELDNGLIEHELDHVFIGYSEDLPSPNPKEVASFRYVSTENLAFEINQHPDRFTEWFKLLFDQVMDRI